jgi:hypothetical protein
MSNYLSASIALLVAVLVSETLILYVWKYKNHAYAMKA